MITSRISRRNFIRRTAGLALTLWAGRNFAQGAWPAGARLDITFEITAQAGFRFPSPYVAVWIENAQGLPVRTLAVWFKPSKPRYLADLRRYSRNSSPPATVSGPTRLPGRYSLVWDGRDDRGRTLPEGDYFVCIETAREDGPYELFRERLALNRPFSRGFSPGGELKAVTVNYGK